MTTLCARAFCGHGHQQHHRTLGCLERTTGTETGYCTCPGYQARPLQPDELEAGRELRDQGAAAAGTTAPGALVTEWRAKAESALATLIQATDPFSADDLVAIAGMPPRPNMLGGIFLAASRQGRIQGVGYTQATRAASHARVQRLWAPA